MPRAQLTHVMTQQDESDDENKSKAKKRKKEQNQTKNLECAWYEY
jgi:hypothetical protein